MHGGAGDIPERQVIRQFERINDLDERGHILQPSSFDPMRKLGDIEEAAAVGPSPMRVALKVGVLQMERTNRMAEPVQPFRHSRAGAV